MPKKLMYYELRCGDGSHYELWRYPELKTCYLEIQDARAAVHDILTRAYRRCYVARAEEANQRNIPYRAKKAWEDERRAACFTETEFTGFEVRWEEGDHRAQCVATGMIELSWRTRYRWREVRQRTVLASDGTITEIVHELGEPGEWSEWRLQGDAVVPTCVLSVDIFRRELILDQRPKIKEWVSI